VTEPVVFRALVAGFVESLVASPARRLTLYAVGLVQVTETEDGATCVDALDPKTAVGAVTWQPETTVTVTLMEAVAVAASAGLVSMPSARKPKMSPKSMIFIYSASCYLGMAPQVLLSAVL
jgi:hypothetical protein